jgi:hypothetical protein
MLIFWIILGILNILFNDFGQWNSYLLLGISFLYIIMYSLNYFNQYLTINNNVIKEKGLTVAQAIEKNQEDAALFTWVVEKEEYEMVVTDDKETWVNFWGLWKGTMKSTNKEYDIPFHITTRFIDGKIVEEYGYWNNSEIVSDLQQLESDTATATNDSIVQ